MNSPEPEYITIGTVVSPWGLHGQMKVDVETDFPQRFSAASRVFINSQAKVIESVSWQRGRAVIKVEGVDTEDEAAKLSGTLVEIHHSQLFTLDEGEYYHFQLVGLRVETTDGEVIGEVTEIMTMASADIYVVKGQDGDILIPAIDEVVKSVEPERGVIVIEPVDGLLNLNRKKSK
jgi:16S rRNA processing protein RimM